MSKLLHIHSDKFSSFFLHVKIGALFIISLERNGKYMHGVHLDAIERQCERVCMHCVPFSNVRTHTCSMCKSINGSIQ